MKNLLYAVVAVALFATACAKDDGDKVTGESRVVTFSLKTPDMQTRASIGKAGNGNKITTLHYAFYDENGILPELSGVDNSFTASTTKEISVVLVEGRKYYAIFWAESSNSPYIVDMTTETVSLKSTTLAGNTEDQDAFWCCHDIGEVGQETEGGEILLTRPLSQLCICNWAKTSIGSDIDDWIPIETSKCVIKDIYTEFDLYSGKTSNPQTLTFDWAAEENYSFSMIYNDVSRGYSVLAKNYVFVSSEAGQQLVDMTISLSGKTITEDETFTDDEAFVHYLTQVPIQANYRTFVTGKFTTQDVAIEMVVTPATGGDNNVVIE